MRDDLQAHVHYNSHSASTGEGEVKRLQQTRGHTLFAYFNLASFCAHFGRMDEAISLLRVAINQMTTATEDVTRRQHDDASFDAAPPTPPPALPRRAQCPYALKTMALNAPGRIADQIERRNVSMRQWQNKIQATINQGHHRSASFYETKVDALREQIALLQGQEEERWQQEEAREDFVQRRLALETHAFDMTVLRRKREAHRRATLEREAREEHRAPSETTHLDLLPQTWECVGLLVLLLERKMGARRGMSGGVFGEEEEEERREVEALRRWIQMRAEFEEESHGVGTVPTKKKKKKNSNEKRGQATGAAASVATAMGDEKEEEKTMPPVIWGFDSNSSSTFESVDWERRRGVQ